MAAEPVMVVRGWRSKLSLAVALAAAWQAAATAPARAFQLVTNDEAALPVGAVPKLELRGSPTRRPTVTVVSPPPGAGLMHSPIDLKLHFQAFGGDQIDPESVIITYVKQPAIDITQRIARYITPTGIDALQAEVPAGAHHFWIELKDRTGRIGAAEFSFQIAR